jgi:DNA-directed RNA polymerase beta subunit
LSPESDKLKIEYEAKSNNRDEKMSELMKEYFQSTRFVDHQIETYNHFISNDIQEIVEREPEIRIVKPDGAGVLIKFGHVYVDRPKIVQPNKTIERTVEYMYPNDARQRNVNYEGVIYTTLKVLNLETNNMVEHTQIPIGKIPVMLRSSICNLSENQKVQKNECSNDFGGYFIIKGKERVLIGQLRRAFDKIYVERSPPGDKFQYFAEIRSFNALGNSVLTHLKMNLNTKEMFFSLPYIKSLLPAGLVFKALGCSQNDMLSFTRVNHPEIVKSLISQFQKEVTPQEAIEAISQCSQHSSREETLHESIIGVCKALISEYSSLDSDISTLHIFTKIGFEPEELIQNFTIKIQTGNVKDVQIDEVLKSIWNFIQRHERKNEMLLKLKNTLEKIYHLSSNQILSHLVSVIQDFCEQRFKISHEFVLNDYITTIFEKEIFYHIGALTPVNISLHLGLMVKKLVNTSIYENRMVDDKDSLSNKRLDSTSSLLGFLFQGLFKHFIKTVSKSLEKTKNPDPINIIKNTNNITYGLNMSFMTGNWNTQKSASYTRVGVSQVLSMQNYGAKMSHLRRIMLPIGKKGKNPHARQLHPSHFSFICPYETPEGDTVGIVSNISLSVKVSNSIPQELVEKSIKMIPSFKFKNYLSNTYILINGKIIGSTDNAARFYQDFYKFRESDMIHDFVSIVWLKDEKEIHIQTDGGRLLRPVFRIDDRNIPRCVKFPNLKTWADHINAGSIVFREVWELEQAVVALSKEDLTKNRCDYMEIKPSMTMMGVMASVIPFSNHSQSPRNAYQASMGKQAIGIPSEAYSQRYDTTLHVLNTPQKPLTKNEMVTCLKFNEMIHGSNPIVAIMTWTGFNQEDSVILNKSSIDRGLFSATTYKTITEEEKKRGNSDFEKFCLPKFHLRNRNYDYSYLGDNGLIDITKNKEEGEIRINGVTIKGSLWLKKGVVIIGKTLNKMVKTADNNRVSETSDASVVIRQGEEGFLDSILDTMTTDGVRIIKIRIRIPRVPEIGDKFASSTAQKGTCGIVYSDEDMPKDKDGISPDLIINPHAIPSRMTINMLIEMCLNLVGCKLGLEMDATPFEHENIEKELEDWAKKAGIDFYTTKMYSGFTGELIPQKVFIAPCFYQRLKHMVADKIHARVAGPLDTLTHQPVAGRARDGGLRFGEMERDCVLSHGSTRILKENLFDKSDKFTIPICKKCGNVPDKRTFCTSCHNEDDIEIKNMPYATKLLCQELEAMGLKLKIS